MCYLRGGGGHQFPCAGHIDSPRWIRGPCPAFPSLRPAAARGRGPASLGGGHCLRGLWGRFHSTVNGSGWWATSPTAPPSLSPAPPWS
eukprot:7325015-Pyramimonas_sp.AAC.1